MSNDSENTKEASAPSEVSFDVGAKDKYELTLEAMLKAGVHFGHKKSRWNPRMNRYIFGVRNGVHVIDLEKTKSLLEEALKFVEEVVKKNGIILVVGTKKQAKDLVQTVGEKLDMPYVNERWLGGTFTNFDVLKKRVKYLVENKEALDKGKLGNMTKLERNKLDKKLTKIEQKMGGLKNMKRLPDAVFVLDVCKDETAVREAHTAGIKVIGLLDSNSNLDNINYPIPANDDALSSLKYILGLFMKTVLEAKEKSVDPNAKE